MKRVLLVEDDRWMAECYTSWLQESGYIVAWSQTAQAALDELDEFKADLIVLDILLPFANGLHFLNVLASHTDLSQIPVVICSSTQPNNLQDIYGVKAVLNKADVGPKQMRTVLAEVFANAPV